MTKMRRYHFLPNTPNAPSRVIKGLVLLSSSNLACQNSIYNSRSSANDVVHIFFVAPDMRDIRLVKMYYELD